MHQVLQKTGEESLYAKSYDGMVSKLQAGMKKPWVIAHRGASDEFPENSFAAFRAAVQQHADAAETDIRLTLDGIPILSHDDDLARITNTPGKISTLTALALRQIKLKSKALENAGGQNSISSAQPEFLLLLDEALHRFPDLPFFLEMKDDYHALSDRRRLLVEQTVNAARQTGGVVPMLLSFSDDLLNWAGELAPEFLRGRNMTEPQIHDYDFLSCAVDTITSEFVQAAHAVQKPVICFTVNEQIALKHSLSCKVDGIISDRPGWLRAEIDRRFS